MYVKRLSITNIASISKLEWNLSSEKFAGWHVIIGDNGAGKTSFMKALALVMIGPEDAPALRQDWSSGSGMVSDPPPCTDNNLNYYVKLPYTVP